MISLGDEGLHKERNTGNPRGWKKARKMDYLPEILERMKSSVKFNPSVVSDSLQLHGLQQTWPPCPSPTSGVYWNSCPLSRWCHPTISSSVVPFCPTFSLSQHQGLFKWVTSFHQVAKILEFQLQQQYFQRIFRTDFFRMDWLDFLAVQGTLKSLLQNHSSKASIFQRSAFFIVQLSHPCMTTGKTIALLTPWEESYDQLI